MKGQAAILGIFLIAIGALMFVWYLLLPAPEKEKLLQEIWNESEYQPIISQKNKVEIHNLVLSKNGFEVLIASNYIIGKEQEVGYIKFGNSILKSNIFSGPAETKLSFKANLDKIDSVELKFITKCTSCRIEIFLNNFKIYNGEVGKSNFTLVISKDYLNQNNDLKIRLKPPINPFSEEILDINNLEIIYLKKTEIFKKLQIPANSKTYLVYDFCPADPNVVKIVINNQTVPVYACSNNVLATEGEDITPYISNNKLEILVSSERPVRVNKLAIKTKAKSFVEPFDWKAKYLEIYVEEGEGTVRINKCSFIINTTSSVFYNISRCTMKSSNILVIETNNYLKISYLRIN